MEEMDCSLIKMTILVDSVGVGKFYFNFSFMLISKFRVKNSFR